MFRLANLSRVLCFIVLPFALAGLADAQEEYFVELANGTRLGPGIPFETDSITVNSMQKGGSGEVQSKSIGYLDDGLRLTFFNQAPRNVRLEESKAPAQVQIEFPAAAEAARSGAPPAIVGILGISEFNKYGRRDYSFMTTRGLVKVTQGITLLTPTFAKVENLRTQTDTFPWDSREATASIPAATLRQILDQVLDLSRSSDWLQMVSFYSQAERFGEARTALAEALQKFPTELADRRPILEQLDQLFANQKFEEIKLRRASGQQKLATQLLGAFPVSTLPLETQLKLQDELKGVEQQLVVIGEVSEALQQHVAQLAEPDQQLVAPIVQELLSELFFDTVVRLSDFQRLRRDEATPNENKVALALSGWMLGPGSGIDNFAVVKSLLRVRLLVEEYLGNPAEARRQQILTQLRSEEGAQPLLLDKLLELMKPPLAAPPHQASDPPGLYRLTVSSPLGEAIPYVAQLPPEYDPNRKYPCVLALPGKGESTAMEIDWWCGVNVKLPNAELRFGQATRYGYIVISPDWMLDKQPEYQYTEGEQDRVLKCMRDAFRRFSIDTDRVFVSGHYDGATAAWDLAVSHPDLWAGAVMISPGADKYILHYGDNVRGKTPDDIPLGTFIVYGDSDPTRSTSQVGSVATKYLTSPTFDSLVVEYRGRGRERFVSELPRIIQWMELSSHRRVRLARNIEVTTMRPGDRFFYWLEAPAILPTATGNPFQFDPRASGTFEAKLLDTAINGVSVSRIASVAKSATIWLSPDMVDFSRQITINMPGNRQRLNLAPDIGIMLEDVRQRADRMHVYWQRVDLK